MSTPGYPDIFYSVGGSTVPGADNLRVRYAPNGRAHYQSLAVYDTCERELNHFAILETELDELMAFWDANRNQEFNWVDDQGQVWLARMRRRPSVTHVSGNRYTAVSTLVLQRTDQ